MNERSAARCPRRGRRGRPAAPPRSLASMSRRASSGIAARIGVSMMPGETALTRTGASSSASARASDSSAPLAALTIAEFGRGRTLRKPETSVSDPPGRISARSRDAPGAPELALHRGAHVVHRHRLERTGAQLRRRDHDMIDRAAGAEQICHAVIAGDIGGDRDRVELFRDRIEALDVARRDDDVGAFALGHFRGRKTNAGGATDHHDFLACKQHAFSSRKIRRADSGCRCRACFGRARAIPRCRRRPD